MWAVPLHSGLLHPPEPWSGKAPPTPTVFMRGSGSSEGHTHPHVPPSLGLGSETLSLHHIQASGLYTDVQTRDNISPHLLLSCCSLSLLVALRPEARSLRLCAQASTLGLCTWDVHECTHLPAGRSAPPSRKLHAEIPALCIFSYMLRSTHGPWELPPTPPPPLWLRDSYLGGKNKDSETLNLPSLRPGQGESLNLARSFPKESPN